MKSTHTCTWVLETMVLLSRAVGPSGVICVGQMSLAGHIIAAPPGHTHTQLQGELGQQTPIVAQEGRFLIGFGIPSQSSRMRDQAGVWEGVPE